MALADITYEAVLAALQQHDDLGREAFLRKYGFGEARSYFLRHGEHTYDSKAIAGAAHGFLKGRSPLLPSEFSGGEKTVMARLKQLGFKVEGPPRNPVWYRDELILALELYFRHPPTGISKSHPEVVRLSGILNELPLQKQPLDAERFRNPNGVYMKLCNFLRFDPEYGGKGLEAGGKMEKDVWDEFAGDRTHLRQIAEAIISGGSSPEARAIVEADDDDEANGFPEGRLLLRLHRARERSSKLREAAKRRAMAIHRRLFCTVCNFDFAAAYGEVGEGYIECHHTKPVSELIRESKTKVEDIALLCANCHRMVHRRRPWLTLVHLADLLPQQQPNG